MKNTKLKILRIIFVVVFFINFNVKAQSMKEINSFNLLPQEYASIQLAIIEFQKHKLSLEDYRIHYKREKDHISISFADKNSNNGLGSTSDKLGFDVYIKMQKNGFILLSSSFSK